MAKATPQPRSWPPGQGLRQQEARDDGGSERNILREPRSASRSLQQQQSSGVRAGHHHRRRWLLLRRHGLDHLQVRAGAVRLRRHIRRPWSVPLGLQSRRPQLPHRLNGTDGQPIEGRVAEWNEGDEQRKLPNVDHVQPGVTVEGATITAPEDSPNTDGIHLHMSRGVSVTGSTMRTGDDCISIGQGVSNVWIENIKCGPGHGISIGSLGASPGEAGVQNVTASLVVFTGTQNGFRVKTWANPYAGFVKDVTFEHATMNNVQNPIVIDQNYCPGNGNCPNKISGVTFSDVQGTSATLVAVTLDCSRSNPCTGIELNNIKLTYKGKGGQQAQSICSNAKGKNSGFVVPPSCLR
ncbi:hypothetical protein HPP92_009111 [Vanilla planifolia]|uniref:Polygalacturonase n=1 Tax=Vanilla planifolia TaxID=51239 RepID=A0A835V8J1_VANPL|nr:hypothetical protein HPP92_009111 [Vanilla planifolia]